MSTLRTAPLVLRHVQVWQMPMRQPFSGARPASSACSSSGRPLFGLEAAAGEDAPAPGRFGDEVNAGGVNVSTAGSGSRPSARR